MFVDTHFHLNMIEENSHLQEKIIQESINKGLKGGINIFTSPTSLLENKEILDKLSKYEIKIACGWYPEHSPSEEKIKQLEEVISKYNIFAIGEIGLEYYRMHKPKEEQIELFENQMSIAQKYNKPVIIHSRDAFEDTLNVLKKYPITGIIHCFSGTPDMAKKYLDLGYYISFAGNLTFKKATDLQESIKYIPLDRLLFETDAPFLAPTPFRGQKNYPYMVKYTYEFAAKLLNIQLEKLYNIILENWKNLLTLNS